VDALDAPAVRAPEPPHPATVTVEVVEAGLLTTVQDLGRQGRRRLGVPQAGALDPDAARAANLAVGNPPDAAVLECVLQGPTLRFHRPAAVALAGADLGAVLERADLGTWPVPAATAVHVRPGNVLSFAGRRAGCRVYLAFAGGLDLPPVLGSRSTDLTAGFGGHAGRPLRSGDVLGVAAGAPSRAGRGPAVAAADGTLVVRVVPGPQAHVFTDEARRRLTGATFEVGPSSDRVGYRLRGPALETAGRGETITDGMVPGCIQVPPDGQPIVVMADGPTTGGYPKIATVVSADLGRLAQLVPGEGRVRFVAWEPRG
jgi:biotin-dependent carboxylase-like uncharacterized protein